VTLKVNGEEFAGGLVPVSAPFAFSTDGFDVGTDLGSPVSPAYVEDAPFRFNGQIEKVRVDYTERR
jgi:arylsulfatase